MVRGGGLLTIAAALSLLLEAGCARIEFTESEAFPPIFPDYVGVTVPEGMVELSFQMEDGRQFRSSTSRVADTLFVQVEAWRKGERTGVRYAPFPVYVSKDEIDPYLVYRLIEPGHESWHTIGIYARELASYRERAIVTNRVTNDGCLNCHTFPGGDPSRMIFHARGKGGGTVFIDGDEAKIVNLAEVEPFKQGTYPAWHPDGRYVAFSSNTTHQSFSLSGTQPIEVYDTRSDIILMDLETGVITAYPPLCEDTRMETFPTWSPDGTSLYFCVADSSRNVARERAQIHYDLCRVAFRDGAFTGEVETVWSSDSLSVSFPRIYGDHLLFTASAYGTFPIWHPEADLWMLDLPTGEAAPVDALNSDRTESYHSWSSNGRWVVFSSRRLDGRYTRLFLAHFDEQEGFSKPFLLPQRDPMANELRLFSYNLPEFVKADPGDRSRQIGQLF